MSMHSLVPADVPLHASERVRRCLAENKSPSFIFQHTVQHLYRRLPLPSNAAVVVAGHVMSDGLGDYHYNKTAAQIIHEAYPQWQITLILSIAEYQSRKNSFPFAHPSIERIFFEDCSEEEQNAVLEKIRKAALVIRGPFDYCKCIPPDVISAIQPKLVPYNECGWASPATGVRSDDYGMIVKRTPRNTELAALHDPGLKAFLMPAGAPYDNDLAYGYLKVNPSFFDVHIQAFVIACCAAAFPSNKTLDIICPLKMILLENWNERIRVARQQLSDPEDLDAVLQVHRSFGSTRHQDFDLSYFETCEIQKIQLFHKNPEGALELVEEVPIMEKGKTLRLINPFLLDHEEDAQILSWNCFLLGCTGDMSLAEAKSYGKDLFYQIMDHKREVLGPLVQIAEEQFGDSHLTKYLRTLYELSDAIRNTHVQEKPLYLALACGIQLQNPEIRQQMRQFSYFLKTHYSFNKVLLDLAARAMGRNLYPQLKSLEDHLAREYEQNHVSLSAAYEQFEKALIEEAK